MDALEFARRGSCVRPPSLEHVVGQGSLLDVEVVEIGDLELSSAGGNGHADEVEDARIV
jgi:hypothetical protein